MCPYYIFSAIKKNDFMKFAGKWMDLENILSEVTQSQKNKYGIYSLMS
jgi:branched-subunit amino acid transport protein AzlD